MSFHFAVYKWYKCFFSFHFFCPKKSDGYVFTLTTPLLIFVALQHDSRLRWLRWIMHAFFHIFLQNKKTHALGKGGKSMFWSENRPGFSGMWIIIKCGCFPVVDSNAVLGHLGRGDEASMVRASFSHAWLGCCIFHTCAVCVRWQSAGLLPIWRGTRKFQPNLLESSFGTPGH